MQIRTFATIDAPAEVAWSVLTDFASFDRWNPMLRRVRGACEEGARIRFRIAFGAAVVPIDAEIVTVCAPRMLRWIGPARRWARGAVSGEHYFELTPTGADQCRLEHGETFAGRLVPNRADWLSERLRPSYEAFNRAFAEEVAIRYSTTSTSSTKSAGGAAASRA